MICPECFGKGFKVQHRAKNSREMAVMLYCNLCGGTGIIHCCEGDICNETKSDERAKNTGKSVASS